ncbi:MAG: hypothetical protein FWG87_12995 [Defluviitaleaceae bacterium]|nr:hypothetical protein [Defluviitaleaceae bacterium]
MRYCLRKSLRQYLTACVNGRHSSRIDERAYLGTDKSVPYKKVIKHGFNGFSRIFSCLADFRGFSHEPIRVIRENPLNPRIITFKLPFYCLLCHVPSVPLCLCVKIFLTNNERR